MEITKVRLARYSVALEQRTANVCAYTTYAMIEPSRWDNQEASI